ncbi:WSC-domain-containing protein [Cystobasidium minutum MCA 4210]|uniref:WSC-domain-containing protein n=1 Tax=Cystobasidium minutum MCA 4210 TaxID=1397322 RepID=UPI0034CE4499|eukprot:jgi/Rhomi1/113952/CE113951_356
MLSKLAVASLAAVSTLQCVQAYFILQGPPVVVERIDPIVSPGQVASHVHNIVGANNIDSSSTYDSLRESTCTSLPITKDLSAYWQPQLYYYNPDNGGSYTAIPSYSKIYYLQRDGGKGNLTAFPPGLRIVAGSPYRSTYDPNNIAHRAINFVCQDYAGGHQGDPEWDDRHDFFKHNCPNGLRAQVIFPACWDGVNLYKSDGSHMSYPMGQNPDNGDCPASHPVHFVTLFQEFVYDVGKFPFNAEGPTWVFATGDSTGYSLHADFQNGWDVDVLQQAIDQCTGDIGGELLNCPPLAPYYNTQAASACRISGDIVNEDVGLTKPISKLPGCNKLYTSGSRPACSDNSTTPDYISPVSTPAAGYTRQGCVAEAPNGRLLTGASMQSNSMTAAVCTAFCGGKGFEFAGIEYGKECYCGSSFSNGGSNATISSSRCNMGCAGNDNEICGGPSTLTLYRNPSKAVVAPKLPSGWKSAGCIADNVNGGGRTLSAYTFSSSNMTQQLCVNTCNDRKFAYAGVSYAAECYCSNAPTTLQTSTNCNMACSGDARYTCGGPNALTLFTTSHVVASGYSYTGCVAEGSSGRLLTGASTTGDDMTPLKCTQFCSSKGLQYSGVEYGRECYCGSSFVNGGSGDLIDESRCSVTCAGDDTQKCGGHSTLSLYSNTALAPKKEVLPSGWTSIGCLADNVAGRTLSAYSVASDSMTHSTCLAACQAKNMTIGGVEYGRECWCSNNMATNATSSKCSMACAGDANSICGGPDALTAFRYTAPAAKAKRALIF